MPQPTQSFFEKDSKPRPYLSRHAIGFYFVAAALIVILGKIAAYQGFSAARNQQSWVEHTRTVQMSLERLRAEVLEAESSSRGYLLSGSPVYIESFEEAEREVQMHLGRVRQFVRDNPEQLENLASAEAVIARRLELLKGRIELYRTAKKITVGDTLDGYRAMQEVEKKLGDMQVVEGNLLKERLASTSNTEQNFIFILVITALLITSGIYFSYRVYVNNRNRLDEDVAAQEQETFRRTKVAEVSKLVAGDLALHTASEAVLPNVADAVDALVGKLFIKEDGALKCYAHYATGRAQAGSSINDDAYEVVSLDQGLIGEAFRKGEVLIQKNLPSGFLEISSSLGRTDAQTVIFVPITFQGLVIGVIELGLLGEPRKDRLPVLEDLGEIIGVGLNAAIVREHTHMLLEKTQMQAEELESQQEELRTTNEELEQQARSLEVQQEALNLRNKELEEARQDVERKASDLERTSRYKSEFLAKMSHELRTPLNSLLILASLLIENKEKNLTDKQTGFAQSIRGAGQDLLNLINDILDLSKIEARKLNLRPEIFDLESFYQSIQSTFIPQLQGRNIAFVIDIDEALRGTKLTTDRLRLEQIMRNFISNAIKFTSKGSVTVGARPAGADKVSLYVRDTGVGIPAEKQALIFDAFEQVDNSLSRSYSGTGLGLTISKELAQLLGGEIQVESQEGVGSVFTLTVPRSIGMEPVAPSAADEVMLFSRTNPRHYASERPAGAPGGEVAAQAREALKGINPEDKTILIVEDDEAFRGLVADATEGFGLKAISTGDGEVALAILEQHVPSAVLLDIKLPGISGLGLLEIIKHSPRLRHVPTHMISALEYQQNALRSGAMGYLTKPVTIDKVKSALSRIEGLLSRQVKRLLIVEDDKLQQDAIRHLVEGEDLEITSVLSGKEALRWIEKEAFDCIILDLSLPDMSGLELLESVENLSVSVPPIVVYTGRDLTREEIKKLKNASGSIIIKGAKSPERLLDEVNLFLHRVENDLPQEKRNMLEQMRDSNVGFVGRKAFVVDDDLRNIFALTSALESKGFEVESAVDGAEAVENLKTRTDIDVILMDIMMPKMDGFEAIRQIRKMKHHAKTPIVALTAKAMKGDHENCIAAGASDYLPKPVNLTNLFSVLKVWLQNKGTI